MSENTDNGRKSGMSDIQTGQNKSEKDVRKWK